MPNTTTPRFLEQLATKVLQHTAAGAKRAVVLPNRRAGVFLRYAISLQVNKPTLLPAIVTIEEFFFQLSGLVKVEPVEQLFNLYHAYESIGGTDDMDKFLTWGPTFLADCNELDTNLVDADAFFTELYYDRELRNWKPNEELTPMQIEYLEFWKKAKDIYQEFTRSLLEENKAYSGLAYRYVVEHLKEFSPKIEYDHITFAGFNALNKAEAALFEKLTESGKAELMWDIDQYYYKDYEHKAGQYFREYAKSKNFRAEKDPIWANIPKNIGEKTELLTVIEAPNNTAQCEVAGELLAQLAVQGPLDNKTAIILADEQLLEPMLYNLPANAGLFNVTMGKSLAQFPLFYLFDALFNLHSALAKSKQGIGFPTSLLKPLLFSPALKKLQKEYESEELYSFTVKNNATMLWQNNWEKILPEESIWRRILQPVQKPAELLELFNDLIEQLRVAYLDQESRLMIQLLFEFKKISNQFLVHLSDSGHQLSLSSLKSLFKQVAVATKLPYEGEPLKGLQIMGVLETRALDFENIIILSANEGILPKGRSGQSFIPHIFKQKYEIQTFKDRDAIYAYSFYRLLHHAKQVWLVYNGQPDVLGGGEPSRFIKQLEAEFHQKTNFKQPIQQLVAQQETISIEETEFSISKTPEMIADIKAYLLEHGLSPSSLNLLLKNPLDFYFRKIANLKVSEEMEENIEASTFGSIVHDTLEELYKPFIGEKLTEVGLKALQKKKSEVLDHFFREHYKQGNIETGMNRLMREAGEVLVEEELKFDLNRIKTETITILSLEGNYERTVQLVIAGKTVPLKIQGKVDRIQEVNGLIEIIDYKSGKVELPKLNSLSRITEDIKQDKLVQLMVYAFLLEGEGYSLANLRPGLLSLRSWQKGMYYLNSHEPNTEITPDHMATFTEQLTLVVQNLLDSSIPFTPETDDKRLIWSDYEEIYS